MVPPTGLYQLSTVLVLFHYLHVFFIIFYFSFIIIIFFFLQYDPKQSELWMEKWQCCDFPLLSINDVNIIWFNSFW